MYNVVKNPTTIVVDAEFAELYDDFIKFCEEKCIYGDDVNEYSTSFNTNYSDDREKRGIAPVSSQTIGHLVRMAGLIRSINRSYRVRRKW